MGLIADFRYPYYEGGTAVGTGLVPGRYPVALGGHPYLIDHKFEQGLRHRSIPQLKPSQDTSSRPGEASLNPEGLWRRSQESWHHGAGQSYMDRDESDPFRFRSSKGVDVWERWQLSLLPATDAKRSSVATNLSLVPVGSYLYLSDGNNVYFTSDITVDTPTWTSPNIHNGESATTIRSITTDGFNLWAALGANGIHTTTRGAASSSHYSDLAADLVGFVKGRLMAAKDDAIYNVTAAGAAPTALLDHPNSDFRWVGFAEGPGFIYAAGYSGDKSLVYKTAVKPDGTGLDVPTVAGELPDGEVIRSIRGYLGFIFLGTDTGLRMATVAEGDGSLNIGARIPTTAAVNCFEGQDRFVWFGWSNYDGVSTGLGRCDPGVIVAAGAPAYASDLMATAQGAVTSVATFGNRRVFAVAGAGVYAEDTPKVATGTLDTGLVTYGLPDYKTAMFLDVRYRQLYGTHRAYLAKNDGVFTAVGTHTETSNSDQFPVGQSRSEAFEVRTELSRSGEDTTLGPIISRYTLKAAVSADIGENIFVPLLLADREDVKGSPVPRNVADELDFIKGLRTDRTLAIYQEGQKTYSVTVEDYEFAAHHLVPDGSAFSGTCLVKLKVVA